jgi:hypothetical protein
MLARWRAATPAASAQGRGEVEAPPSLSSSSSSSSAVAAYGPGSGSSGGAQAPLLTFAMAAATVHGQQRQLRQRLDELSRRWTGPRLQLHWDYCKGTQVEIRILCDGTRGAAAAPTVTSVISAVLREGQVHAQYVGAVASGVESPVVFPLTAVHAIGSAEDGVGSLVSLVHAALGRTLLLRVRERAEACGLSASIAAMGTTLTLARAGAQAGAWGAGSSRWSESSPSPPWLRLTIGAAPVSKGAQAPVQAVLCSSMAEAPRAVDVLKLARGRSLQLALVGLLAHELLVLQ